VHGPSEGRDDPLVWFEGAGVGDSARRYLFTDERGSVVAVTDGNGNALAIDSYDEYGIPAAGNQGRFQYTGQAWVPELGMYYYKARMYSPTLGRFMQTDPIGYADGMNMYAYVRGDPVNGVDPTGLEIVVCASGTWDGENCAADIVVTGTRPEPYVSIGSGGGFFWSPGSGMAGSSLFGPDDGGGTPQSGELADRCLGRASALGGTPAYKATVVLDTVKAKFVQHESSFRPNAAGTSTIDQSYWASTFGLGDLEIAISQSRAYGATRAANGAVRVTFDTGKRVGYDRDNAFAATNFVSIYFSAPTGRDPQTGLPIRTFVSARPGC